MRCVHESDLGGVNLRWLHIVSGVNALIAESAVFVQDFAGVSDDFAQFLRGIQVDNFVGHPAVFNAKIRRFNKSVFVNLGIGRQVQHQTDVSAFRRFHRTNAAVVRWVGVAHVETSAFAAQTARPHGAQSALVAEL